MTATWSGRKVQQARLALADRTAWPSSCARGCGRLLVRSDRWVLGHIEPRWKRPDLVWAPSNWQVECRPCSDASAQAEVIAKAKAEALAEHGIEVGSSLTAQAAQPPRLPVSLPATPRGLGQVRADLEWTNATRDAPAWLQPYLDVPHDVAAVPLAMTPPHPEATGSYGPTLIEWAAETLGVHVRWWQGLSLVRILEHRADGSLVWEEWLLSASRRSGKSVIVRLLALWRLLFAPGLFGEQQLIVHSASTLKIAKEPMRYASRWARTNPELKVSTNNNNFSFEHSEGHRWLVVPIDSTAGLDTCLGLIDEAWKAKPEVVDDDLEPSLLERVSPQLGLVSTAHRRATSLMRGRLLGALGGDASDGRTLVLLWAAPPEADPSLPSTWKAASPHWSEQRLRMIRAKYDKALSGQDDPEFDDPDPLAGWHSQFLNAWPLADKQATRGEALVEPQAWEALVEPPPLDRPDTAAIESWFDQGVSLALGWRSGSHAVLSVSDHPDLTSAVAALRESEFRGRVTVGASLLDDPALKGISTRRGEGRTLQAVEEMARLMSEDRVRHDGGEHLTEQVLGVRTLPGADGRRMASNGRADAVKAACWCVARTKFAGSTKLKILLPSGV